MPCNMINQSVDSLTGLKKMAGAFFPYAEKQLGFDQPVSIIFQSDADNAQNMLGKTAQYDPDGMSVTLFTDGRHPKDVLRSLSHELVHHAQNCRGEFDSIGDTSLGYAQRDGHLRGMEEEAYKLGNLIFRDWEDMFKQKAVQLQEGKLRKTLRKGLGKLLKEGGRRRSLKEAPVPLYIPGTKEVPENIYAYGGADDPEVVARRIAGANKPQYIAYDTHASKPFELPSLTAASGPVPVSSYTDPESDAWKKGPYGGKGRYITGPNASEELKQYLEDVKDIQVGQEFIDDWTFSSWKHPSQIPKGMAAAAAEDLALGRIGRHVAGPLLSKVYKAAPRATMVAAGAGVPYAINKYMTSPGPHEQSDKMLDDLYRYEMDQIKTAENAEAIKLQSKRGKPMISRDLDPSPGRDVRSFNPDIPGLSDEERLDRLRGWSWRAVPDEDLIDEERYKNAPGRFIKNPHTGKWHFVPANDPNWPHIGEPAARPRDSRFTKDELQAIRAAGLDPAKLPAGIEYGPGRRPATLRKQQPIPIKRKRRRVT